MKTGVSCPQKPSCEHLTRPVKRWYNEFIPREGGARMHRFSLMPDRMVMTYRDVSAAFLTELEIKLLFVDIDNTLAPYEQPEPDEHILNWVADIQGAGVEIVLVSNNNPERVERFNKDLGLKAYPKTGKPFSGDMKRHLKDSGLKPEQALVLGDQLITDAWAGHGLGIRTVIVPPIRDKRTWFFRFKRWLERPVIRRYMKEHPEYVYPFEQLKAAEGKQNAGVE